MLILEVMIYYMDHVGQAGKASSQVQVYKVICFYLLGFGTASASHKNILLHAGSSLIHTLCMSSHSVLVD